MVAPLSPAPPVKIRRLPQEQEGKCRFSGQFVVTRHALDHFGQEVILVAWLMLKTMVSKGVPLDYLQVFEINGERLWIIDDGDVVTALLPEDY
jgi:hypothetical protein